MFVYSIYDSKLEDSVQSFFAPNDGVAARMFTALAQEPGSKFNQFAADFTLFRVGSFNTKLMVLEDEVNQNMGTALNYVSYMTEIESNGKNSRE